MDAEESSAGSLPVVASNNEEKDHILHSFHRHPLKQRFPFETDPRKCNICSLVLPKVQTWECVEEGCDFHIHEPCLDSLGRIAQRQFNTEFGDIILYPLGGGGDGDEECCISCGKSFPLEGVAFTFTLDSTKYMCIQCRMFTELQDTYDLARSSHVFHTCGLELTFSPSTTCNACFQNGFYLSYACYRCSFFLDTECFKLQDDRYPSDSKQIRHFCLWHPLQPFLIDGETLCKLCENSSSSSSTSNSFYGCTECQFYVHESCMHILTPKTIHPWLNEEIVLLTVPSYVCRTCDRACSGLTFYSNGVNFCVKCILWPVNEFSGYGGFESIHHRHELTITEVTEVDEATCFMCRKDCSGLNYECKKCCIYFHKSCAELPGALQHPVHPLTLVYLDAYRVAWCKLCLEVLPTGISYYNRCYRCASCGFTFDSHCASSYLSAIEYQGHPHLLLVGKHLPRYHCDKCHEAFREDSTVLRCEECDCDFGLHLECGPLPCKIKDPRHSHALTLQEYYVEDNDMSDLFACHICEDKRNPRERVYLCTEGCLMTCHVECVLSEVVASLRGERGLLELDTVYPKVACKLITSDSNLKEIIPCANKGENNENVATDVPVFSLMELIESAKPDIESEPLEERNNKLKSGASDLRRDGSIQSYYDGRNYHYSQKALKQFINNIEGNQGLDFDWYKFWQIFSQLEGTRIGGDYLLPNTLDSVYNHFFARHTLFGPDCKLNHDQKRLIVFYICCILHDMRMTKVRDVSAERVALWSSALKAVRAMDRHNGLELDFLFKHVKRIAEDHYMVQAVDIIEDTFSKMCKKNRDLSARKEWLIRELTETNSNIEDSNEELRKCRAYRYAGARETKKEYLLDSQCASFVSAIEYQGHPHLLHVGKHLPQYNCEKCSEYFPIDSAVLRCGECNFGLHLECGPLPCKIKDPRHSHPLTLQEYYVEDNDMSDLFACHICEEKRNPRERVYLCTEGCLLTCHVKCVVTEVVASLRGERGLLELDTVYPKVACKMITRDSNLKEIITCASRGENNEDVATDVPVFSLMELIKSAKPNFELEERNNKLKSGTSDLKRDDSSQSDYDGHNYHYSRKAFKQFIKNIEGNQGLDFDSDKFAKIFLQLEGSRVGGDYLLPNTLDSVYNHFFARHTLFGPDCKLNHDQKRLIVFYICCILHDMRMTKVRDVSAERVALWSSALKAVRAMDRHNGLELDFLFKHVKRIAEDHYMVQAVDIIEDTFSEMCNEIRALSEREEWLIRELAATRRDIEDSNEELRKFRAYRYAGARETKKEYYASLENKWRPCYEC